jgi:hypothetical protein
MLPLTTIMGVQPKNGVDKAAPTMIAANTVTAGSAVSSYFGFFLFKRLLLSNSCWGTLPVAVPTATLLRDRLFVASLFSNAVRDKPDRGEQGDAQNEIHNAVPFCVRVT